MGWVTFWATFSPTHLATLDADYIKMKLFIKEIRT
jgi:hypothetical protein